MKIYVIEALLRIVAGCAVVGLLWLFNPTMFGNWPVWILLVIIAGVFLVPVVIYNLAHRL